MQEEILLQQITEIVHECGTILMGAEDMRGKISADSDGQSLRIKIELSLCPAEDS